jgi:hypothetical protein
VVDRIGDSDLRTAFLARSDAAPVHDVAMACLEPSEMMRIHGEVVGHSRVPSY